MQIFGVSWRLLGEQSSFNGNDVDTGFLACSKPSDSGERCEVKKALKSRGGNGDLSSSLTFTFSRSFFTPHYLNAWNRLLAFCIILPFLCRSSCDSIDTGLPLFRSNSATKRPSLYKCSSSATKFSSRRCSCRKCR